MTYKLCYYVQVWFNFFHRVVAINELDVDFESLKPEILYGYLKRFYAEARHALFQTNLIGSTCWYS